MNGVNASMELSLQSEISRIISTALDEDIGSGDATTNAIIPAGSTLKAEIIAKQEGVVCGIDIVEQVFRMLDPKIQMTCSLQEGGRVTNRQQLAVLQGNGRVLITGERTALNILGRMSGIATATAEYVKAVAGTGAVILDTRKTVPGLRVLDKLAVQRGGGANHRIGLFDMILIKDNHIDAAGSIRAAVERAIAAGTGLAIEIEVRTLNDVREALELQVDRILLDNMTLAMMRDAVSLCQNRVKLEASGNVSLTNVREIAETGVQYISIGALTHSVKNFDVSMLL